MGKEKEKEKEKTYFGHYQCNFCDARVKVEVDPDYNPEGYPVILDVGPPMRWGAIPTMKEHECKPFSTGSRYGVASLIGYSVVGE